MRARTSRDDDQFGNGDDALDGHGDSRRSVDDGKAETLLAKDFKVRSETGDGGLGKSGHFRFALVPPIGKAALRIDVDKADRACAR
jgi:hypothetical protein